MTDAQIIEALIRKLGGRLSALAERLGESNQTVSNWKALPRGIAWPKRSAVAELAAELGVKVPSDFQGVKRASNARRAA